MEHVSSYVVRDMTGGEPHQQTEQARLHQLLLLSPRGRVISVMICWQYWHTILKWKLGGSVNVATTCNCGMRQSLVAHDASHAALARWPCCCSPVGGEGGAIPAQPCQPKP
jgi:hypothetical protein